MFAFALWDRNRETLFLARDRLGVKPLHYALLPDGTLLFGSELKSLLAHGGLARDIDPLRGRGILRARLRRRAAHDLPRRAQAAAGAHARASGAASRCRRRASTGTCGSRCDSRDRASTTRAPSSIERLRESVRLRMISEVPLGAFLSGGVDSSAVVAMMAGLSRDAGQHLLDRVRRSGVRRVALRAAGRRALSHAATTSSSVESDDFDLIDTLARLYDEPYADSSAIPTYRVCQLARKHVTVALSGDGGDESFGGYRRYRLHLMEERMRARAAARRCAGRCSALLGRVVSEGSTGRRACLRAKTTFEALARDSVEAYFHGVSILRGPHARAAVQRRASSASSAATTRSRCSAAHAATRRTDDPLALIQYLDLKTYLVGDINTKVDRASMAHSLEVREPLMDHPLVEWLATLPSIAQDARRRRQVPAEEGDGAAPAARDPVPAEDGLRRAARALVPRAAAGARARRGARRRALADTGLFDRALPARTSSTRTSPARATTARRCGRC